MIHPLYRLLKTTISPRSRSELNLKKNHSAVVHQLSTFTNTRRYIPLFINAAKRHPRPKKILSFGCSTGKELLALKTYFPEAEISGVDLNSWALSKAKKTCKNSDVKLYGSLSELEAERFDLITALAVFQRSVTRISAVRNIAEIYPFPKFEATINSLDILLKVGGMLMLDYCDYSFIDTDVSKNYQPLSIDVPVERDRPLFDIHGNRCAPRYKTNRLFVKVRLADEILHRSANVAEKGV